jgi:hypothetical protein
MNLGVGLDENSAQPSLSPVDNLPRKFRVCGPSFALAADDARRLTRSGPCPRFGGLRPPAPTSPILHLVRVRPSRANDQVGRGFSRSAKPTGRRRSVRPCRSPWPATRCRQRTPPSPWWPWHHVAVGEDVALGVQQHARPGARARSGIGEGLPSPPKSKKRSKKSRMSGSPGPPPGGCAGPPLRQHAAPPPRRPAAPRWGAGPSPRRRTPATANAASGGACILGVTAAEERR